ncbi:MAG: DUF4838 domain-containing protein [Clostridia bacterium]|nr:DUF4838 domain-containing protein [Clostridia bacterium]
MKILSKFIALLLGCVTAVSVFAACDGGGPNVQSGQGNANAGLSATGEKTDIGRIVKTDKVIIQNGVTDYQILLPAEASDDLKTAASELKFFVSESMNVNLSTTTEYEANGKYFSLGFTEIAKANGFTCSYGEVGVFGYKLKTVGDDICIYGFTDSAVVYGVYEYLERMFEFEYYSENIYNLNQLQTLYLYDFDCVDVPDFDYRVIDGGFLGTGNHETTRRRMRGVVYHESFINPTAMGWGCWHNDVSLLSAAKYYELHPEWYNDEFAWANDEHTSANSHTSQLCYTAHGDDESLALMIETTAQIMFEVMQAYPLQSQISMNMQDNGNECDCDSCNEDLEKYGARASSLILFFNRVAPLLEQKLAAVNDPRVDSFKISFYAYYEYQEAPVTAEKNKDGSYTYTYAPEMKLNEHVTPLYANIKIKFAESTDSEDNAWHYLTLKKWEQIAPGMAAWVYNAYFWSFGGLVHYDYNNYIQEHLKAYREVGVDWIFMQTRSNTPTAFQVLKNYLIMKLFWDIDADVAALTDKFFKVFYGSESEEMKTLYFETRALMSRNVNDLGLSTDVQNRNLGENSAWWPKAVLKDWYDRMKAAEKRLIAAGEMVAADNVKRETISPLFLMVHNHLLTYSPAQLAAYKAEVIGLFDYFGYTAVSEQVGLESMLVPWG